MTTWHQFARELASLVGPLIDLLAMILSRSGLLIFNLTDTSAGSNMMAEKGSLFCQALVYRSTVLVSNINQGVRVQGNIIWSSRALQRW